MKCIKIPLLRLHSSVWAQWTVLTPLLCPITNSSLESNRLNQVKYIFHIFFPHSLRCFSPALVSLCLSFLLTCLTHIYSHSIYFHYVRLFFPRYYFTLSTVSVEPLWSWEDWTTDWTIYFCKDTSVSNHSISRCLYRTRTHARLFLIEILRLVNRHSVILERNTVRVWYVYEFCHTLLFSSKCFLSSHVSLAFGKMEIEKKHGNKYKASSSKSFFLPDFSSAWKPNSHHSELSFSKFLLFFTAVIMPYAAQSIWCWSLGWQHRHLESPSVLI